MPYQKIPELLHLGLDSDQQSFNKIPLTAYHFQVSFFHTIIPNPFDIRFQRVSGLSGELEMNEIVEGGNTHLKQETAWKAHYDNLVLERGVFIGSPLRIQFNITFSLLSSIPTQVLVMVLDPNSVPTANWLLFNAQPVKWEISDLDANENALLIERMELSYQRYQYLSL